MEPAKIDWKRIESIFVEDELYEHINAPKWVDFLATQESVDDEAWFCRPSKLFLNLNHYNHFLLIISSEMNKDFFFFFFKFLAVAL
jgi:hypothetical protein